MNERIWRVLLVDDDAQLREPLASWLRTEYGYHIDTAASRKGAWQHIHEQDDPYDVVLIDDMLLENESDLNGFPMPIGVELMAEIKEAFPDVASIIFTGWSGTERGLAALRAGAYRYLSKPIEHEELALTIQVAVQHHQLKKQKKLLQTFIKVGQTTTSIRSLDEVLEEVHRQVGSLMDASGMAIALYDKPTEKLRFELFFDRGAKQEKRERPFNRKEGLTEWVITQGKQLLIKDFAAEKESLPKIPQIEHFGENTDQEITQSWLSVPLVARDQVIGAMNLHSYNRNEFDEIDQYILGAIANQVAGAIQNARLFSKLYEERERKQALLQSSLDAIVAIDNNKRITVFNKQAEKFFGHTEAEMHGQRTFSLFEDVEVGRQIFDELDGGTSITERQINFKHKNGPILPGLFSATVIKDEAGQPIGQAGFVRDLRDVKLLETRQRAWSDVSQAVTQSEDLNEILNLIVHSTAKSIPAANDSEIHLYRDGTLCLVANTINYSKSAMRAIRFKEGEGVNGKVFESRQPMIINDVKQDSRFKQVNHPEAAPFESMVCVPIQTSEHAMGTLALTSKEQNAFKEVDLDLLNSFASQAAVVIKNSELLDKAKHGLSCLKSVSEASSILISKQEPQKVLEAIVVQARKALNASRASAILIDNKGRPKELAEDGYKKAPDVKTVIRENGISAQVMTNNKPCFIENVATNQENLSLNSDMKKAGICAAACLPLKLGENAIGVMWIQYKQPRIFTETEREALQMYSEQAALAYDKTRQMQELQHMRQAADALAGAADLPEVLTQIVSSARKVLGADSAAIWSYDDIRKKFLLNYSFADGIKSTIWKQFIQEEPQVGQTADTVMKQGSLVVEKVTDQKRYPFLGQSTRRLLKQVGIKSFQGIALTVGNERLGVLYVNYSRTRHFSREEVEIAATFADHAALALKKARLLEQLNKTQNAAHIVAQVTALENLDATLDSVVTGMVEAVECSAVTLYVYNQHTSKLYYPPAVAGLKFPKRTRRLPEVPEDSIVLKMLWRDETYIVENTANDPDFSPRRFVQEEKIKSCAAIPLIVGGVRVGVLFVNYRQFHRFTHEELQNIELFASQAAVAIRNAQLYKEVQERSEIRRALYKANEAISNSLLDEQATLNAILEQAVNITKRKGKNVGRACIREVENGVSRLISVFPHNLDQEDISQNIIKVALEDYGKRRIGIMGRAALKEEVQRVGDVSQDSDYLEVDPDVRSELAVPFKLGNAVIVINVEHEEKDAYDEIDEVALEVLASQAAIAIENAQLYQKSETFRKVAEALSSTNKLNDVLNVVIQEAMTLTNTPMGNITFWDVENEKASDALRVESDGKLHRYPSVARKNGTTRRIVDNREAVVIPDKRLEKNPNPIYKERGFLAEVGVPIETRKKVLGVLYVRHPESHHFPNRQVKMLKTLGQQAGLAIERARTVGFIGNKTAVDWIQMVSTTWGHSLNREVGIAKGRIKWLSALANLENKDEFEEQITSLEDVLNRITNLTITAPLTYEDVTKAIPINELLNTYLERQWKHARFRHIFLSLDLRPDLDKSSSVWASPEWLRRGFELIVDNAVLAMQEAGTPDPKIWVTTRSKDTEVLITIENNGPTISDVVLEHFRQGRAIPKNDGDRGSGIGLQLTKTIFETYRGTMQIEKREPQGASVTFTLPKFQPNEANKKKNAE
ncbi:GAF domain-containing protein [Candidatus Leptofilum sp.]|uniref:GAF domain-containing protein n=1 Tax=Candidatus Leptofilum sp. TaxID=3241576 RepID=UPI003B5CCD04